MATWNQFCVIADVRSWLNWKKNIATPERGCIAVLQLTNDSSHGHVILFLKKQIVERLNAGRSSHE